MNGLPWTAGHPDWVALAADDFASAGPSPSVPNDQTDLPTHGGRVADPRRDTVPTFEFEDGAAAPAALRAMTKAICGGDEAAFTQFYELYSMRLYRHLLVLAKGNEGEAREVLQTVVVKVAKGFKVFDEERRLWGWLCRLARNAYVDLCRARRRNERFVPLEEQRTALAAGCDGEHRLSESLHNALEQLTAEELELMRAAYVDERPLQELATESGRTYKAVESRLARLRRKLKMILINHLRHENSA